MTSTFKGIEPPLPTGSSSFTLHLPPDRTASQAVQLPPRSWPRQTSMPDPSSGDNLEPPLKKPRLEDATGSRVSGAMAGRTPRPTAFTYTASREHTPSIEQNQKQSRDHQHSVFPLRPGVQESPGGIRHNRPLALVRATRKDAVPVKAYIPEPPSCAPQFHEAGMYLGGSYI